MAKRTYKKLNVEDIFLDDSNDKSLVNLFVGSQLFAIFATAYNTVGGRLRVGKLLKTTLTDGREAIKQVTFVTPVGFSVGKVAADYSGASMGETLYHFAVSGNVLGDVNNPNMAYTTLSTQNPAYMRSKLSATSNHDAKGHLMARVTEAEREVDIMLRAFADNGVDKKYGDGIARRPSFGGTDDINTIFAEVAMGEKSIHEVPQSIMNDAKTLYDRFRQKVNKFNQAVDSVKDILVGEKWVLVYNLNGGLILGAINTDATSVALDMYKTAEGLPGTTEHKYSAETVPLKWYGKFEDVPEDTRKEVEYQLMILKTHTNSKDLFPSGDRYGVTIWDIGAANYCPNMYAANILLLPK